MAAAVAPAAATRGGGNTGGGGGRPGGGNTGGGNTGGGSTGGSGGRPGGGNTGGGNSGGGNNNGGGGNTGGGNTGGGGNNGGKTGGSGNTGTSDSGRSNTGSGQFDDRGTVASAPPSAPGAAKPGTPSRIDPFPVVRIKGVAMARGAKITLLSVRAPRGARVSVQCSGGRCPRKSMQRPARGTVRLKPYERFLRAGLKLTIRIGERGLVGKHTMLKIRAGRAPARRDSCMAPGSPAAIDCAAL